MVQHDFAVLHLRHPSHLVRDTAKASYAKLLLGLPKKPNVSLRTLTQRLFGVHIQTGEHCSLEDARATMAIYRLVEDTWELDLKYSKPRRQRHRKGQLSTNRFSEDADAVSELNCSPKVMTSSCIEPFSGSPSRPLTTIRPGSSASLLDDLFWPNTNDDDATCCL